MAQTFVPPILETLPDTGAPPKARVKDAASAASIVFSMIQGNQERNRKWTLLRGMLDGNPPYSASKLRSSGQAYRSNFASLEGKSISNNAKTPYYELFVGGKTFAEVKLATDESNNEELGRKTTEMFDRRLKEHPNFQIQMWKLLDDFVNFGRGHLVWEEHDDWKFRQIPFDRVLFPDATDVDVSLWDYFMVRQEVPVHWLWSRIKEERVAAARGWNIEACRKAIQLALPDDPERGWTDYMRVQQELKDNDLYLSSKAHKVKIANLFVREFSGEWSWMIVMESGLSGTSIGQVESQVMKSGKPDGAGQAFLFHKIAAFPEIKQFMSCFFLDVCNGSINGLTGLANDIYAFVMVKDRMINTIADNTFLRSALIVQANDASSLNNASLTMFGNMVIIPPGLSIQSSQVVGDVETSLAVARDFDARIQNNTGVYRPQMLKPQGNPRTATEAELNFTTAATLTTSAVNRFYDQLDATYAEIYRRMSEHDKTFIKWCKEEGVTKEHLSKVECVRSSRVIGAGSVTQKQQSLQALMPLYFQYPPGGQRNLLAAVTAAYTDQSKVDMFMPPSELENLPGRHHWDATQENAALKEGAPVIWTPEQDDSIHAQVHLGAAMQAIQSASPNVDLAGIVGFASGIAGHVASTHLPRLQASNPTEAKTYAKVLQEVISGTNEIKQALQKQAQQQQQSQQRSQELTFDQQLDASQVQGKMQLSQAKTQHQMQLRDAQAKQKAELANVSTAAEIQRQGAKAANEIQIARQKAASRSNGTD